MNAPDLTLRSIDETARQRFEQSWIQDQPESIETVLPSTEDPLYQATLEELVLIDLEFRWKHQLDGSGKSQDSRSALSLDDYVGQFPSLGDTGVMRNLVVREMCLRQQLGDQPDIRQTIKAHPGVFESERHLLTLLADTGYAFRSQTVSLAINREARTIMGDESSPVADAPTLAPVAATSGDFAEIPETVGNYRLIRELGAGGMGRVYEAEDTGSGQRVALKLVLPHLVTSQESLDRFRQEGQLASTISHPRCVFVLAADQAGQFPYIVMELVSGTDLAEHIAANGPLEQDDAIRKMIDVIDGLAEAHRLGVIHRDVKPSNCFLDADGRVKIGDFGLSRTLAADVQLTQPGTFIGTPQYCAPEQVRNDPLDGRCDVYSVTATLYYLLTGQAPFHGNDTLATMARIVSDPAPSIRMLRPDLPRQLESVIAKGLERDPDRRWQSMEQFRHALTDCLPQQLTSLEKAGRLGSWLVDGLVWLGITAAIGQPLRAIFGMPYATSWWPQVVTFGSLLAYYTLCEGRWGTTLGKRILRFRVQVVGQGRPPSYGQALARISTLVVILDGPVIAATSILQNTTLQIGHFSQDEVAGLVLSGLRYISWAIVCSTMRTRNGFRGLHEMISGTCVVRKSKFQVDKREVTPLQSWLSDELPVDEVATIGTAPAAVGAYQVTRSLRWDNEKIVAARDERLGRDVLVRMCDPDNPPPTQARARVARNSRPRWLSSERTAENSSDAFLAPAGRPLDEIVEHLGPLDWPTTEKLLLDLAGELSESIEDGTLPEQLSTHQVWIDTDMNVVLMDFATAADVQEIAAQLVSPSQRAFALLGATAMRALEGQPIHHATSRHDIDKVVKAVIPMFARDALYRLFPGEKHFNDIQDFHKALLACQERPVRQVTRIVRAKLTLFQLLALFFGTTIAAVAGTSISIFLSDRWDDSLPEFTGQSAVWFGSALILLSPLPVVVWCMCFRGGWMLPASRIQIVDSSGRRASRLRIGLRTWVVFLPFSLLGLVQFLIHDMSPQAGAYFPIPWLVLPVVYFLVAIIWPRRGPQDLIASTYLVPR